MPNATLLRPRLLPHQPVLWRTGDCLELGTVRIPGATSNDIAWLLAHDGVSSPGPAPTPAAAALLAAAVAHGCLEDAATMPLVLRWAPHSRTHQANLLAAAAALRDAESAKRALDRRHATRVRVPGSDRLAMAVRPLLEEAGLTVCEGTACDITVLTPAHPDLATEVSLPDGPHLVASVYGHRGVIGPLVVPDVTSCLHCRDLHRRDADRSWPLLSVQWAQAVVRMQFLPIDALQLIHAAVEVVTLVRAWADDPLAVDQWGNHAVLLDLAEGRSVSSSPAHPLCGCRWQLMESSA